MPRKFGSLLLGGGFVISENQIIDKTLWLIMKET